MSKLSTYENVNKLCMLEVCSRMATLIKFCWLCRVPIYGGGFV